MKDNGDKNGSEYSMQQRYTNRRKIGYKKRETSRNLTETLFFESLVRKKNEENECGENKSRHIIYETYPLRQLNQLSFFDLINGN